MPNEVLELLREKEITLVITLKDGTMWTIDGLNINDGELYDTDMFVEKTSKETGNISVDIIDTLASTRTVEQLIFAYNDVFGFMGQLTLDANNISGNKAVFLQTVISEDDLDMVDNALITNNTITFEVTKGADSAIVYGYNGDLNADESITIKDMMLMLHSISGRSTLNEVQKGFADVDMNDKINLQDLMREMHYISGRETELYPIQ